MKWIAVTKQTSSVYIAGPMRGLPLYNFPAFDHAAKYLRARGFTVVSPADMDREHGFDPVHIKDQKPFEKFEDVIARDLAAICKCDAMALLPDWERSEGVTKYELPLALNLNKLLFDANTGLVIPSDEVRKMLEPVKEMRYSNSGVESGLIHRFERAKAELIGKGGAPMRATVLPEAAADRKEYPIASGFLDYFPDAICEIAHVSKVGNDQHNPGNPLHWDRSKSGDEGDTMQRHFLQRGTRDKDGCRHTAKMAWRALALLQKEIEADAVKL